MTGVGGERVGGERDPDEPLPSDPDEGGAAVEVPEDDGCRCDAPARQRVDQVEATARRVGFAPGLLVGRAVGQAEAAVDALA